MAVELASFAEGPAQISGDGRLEITPGFIKASLFERKDL